MSATPSIGGKLLRLVTGGMYDDPLVLYREYVQNAADAIQSRGGHHGSVHVHIDPAQFRITILDDGTGLSSAEAHRLLDIGCSAKDPEIDRGFRGIGRLAGLAFAEQVHFTTRARAVDDPVRVTWNGRALRELELSDLDALEAIQQSTTTRPVSEGDWPERFFQVTIDGVSRHAASVLLNEDTVRNYLAQVCPVPMRASFPLADKIQTFLSSHAPYLLLDIRINDDRQTIKRPFADTIPLTDQYGAPFESLETHVIPRPDGDDPAAILWLAHTPYAGSIPRRLGLRGLRARAGNIQIGSDRIFERLFLESRFNGWCVGEVHILDSRIVPNGRRDYFEPGPHLRNLENHLGAIAQNISSRCRLASSQRNKLRNVAPAIRRLNAARDLAVSGYLKPSDAAAIITREQKRIPQIQQTLAQVTANHAVADVDDFALCEHQFAAVATNPAPPTDRLPPESVDFLQSAFGTIAERLPPDTALELIHTVVQRLALDDTVPHAD